MKKLLLILAVLFPCLLQGQPRYPNYYTTNANPALSPSGTNAVNVLATNVANAAIVSVAPLTNNETRAVVLATDLTVLQGPVKIGNGVGYAGEINLWSVEDSAFWRIYAEDSDIVMEPGVGGVLNVGGSILLNSVGAGITVVAAGITNNATGFWGNGVGITNIGTAHFADAPSSLGSVDASVAPLGVTAGGLFTTQTAGSAYTGTFTGSGANLTGILASAISAPGSNTMVLFNDNGAPAGATNFVFNKTTGNVGIGTTVPFAKLHVRGGVIMKSTTDFNNSTVGSSIYLNLGAETGDTYGIIGAVKTGSAVSSLAIMPYGGNVGIGTDSPTAGKLVVAGNVYATGTNTATAFVGSFTGNGAGLTNIPAHLITNTFAAASWYLPGSLRVDTNLTVNGDLSVAGTRSTVNEVTLETNRVTAGSFVGSFTSYRSNLLAWTSFTMPATTINWTNPLDCSIMVKIDNTGVTGSSVKINGTQVSASVMGDETIPLQIGEFFSETFTIGTPTATFHPFP